MASSVRFPAISIRQPSADRILRGPLKRDVRSRPTRFRGWILLHASRTLSREERAKTKTDGLETGKVVMSGPSSVVKNDENVRKSYLGY